ncbi:OmpA family protein, partial [bacterium]
DADKDGVIDSADKCPGTAAGIVVDANGCPKDSDNDGLIDSDETGKYKTDPNNPDTDGDTLTDGDEVNKYKSNPLKADSDDDRLKDGEEVKLGTDPNNPDTDGGSVTDGVEVSVAGTNPLDPKDDVKKARSIQLLLEFDSGSDKIKPEYMGKIEEVANFLKEFPEVGGTIEGHTDSAGADAYNMELSNKRAKSVVTLLEEKYGITKGRINSKGYGETKPVADNAKPEGRAKNRRIIAAFEYKGK